MNTKKHVIVAIDGMSAAGKSSLAALLKEKHSCNIISMDRFFLRPVQRTPERLDEPGGNIDYERFRTEIIEPLRSGKSFAYRPYDCRKMELAEPILINPHPLTVIEGVYSMHPYFTSLYDVSVFLSIADDCQRQRLFERDPSLLERFINEWIPMEKKYFKHFEIPEKCEIIFKNFEIMEG